MRFAKGHGTGNDFVLLPDPDGAVALTPALVAGLCDRRFGIGGDGVLRLVRTAKLAGAVPDADPVDLADAEWFMDYRNADGSVAEMCGNGIRVFARYLVDRGLVAADRFPVGTRAGLVHVQVGPGEEVTAEMPRPRLGQAGRVAVSGRELTGTRVDVGNPHLVCPVADLSAVDLSVPPVLDPEDFPESANVEFVAPGGRPGRGEVNVRMRVYERGSAETLSCGTGACAVALVALRDAGRDAGVVDVDLPGGRLTVAIDGDRCRLTGPAVIVAEGDLCPPPSGRVPESCGG